MNRALRRRSQVAAFAVVALLAGFLRATPAAAEEQPAPTDRSRVVDLWQVGGAQMRAAAEVALVGTDDQVLAFLDGGWQAAQRLDERDAVVEAVGRGGPAVRAAGKQALDAADAGDENAIGNFLGSGWQNASDADARLSVNQLRAAGGPQVREAAQKVLDSQDPDALRTFAESGWQTQWMVDQRLRVNQARASGGPEVRAAGQRALDAGTPEALEQFLEYGWAAASARDDEVATLTDLLAQARSAGDLAAQETQAAKDEGARAKEAAENARRAAVRAAEATAAARDDAQEAGAQAKRAAYAAEQASQAAQVAVAAAAAASRAARAAAAAASRTAAAAARADRAAATARKAAADAATDGSKAQAARMAAQEAAQIAVDAKNAASTAQATSNAIDAARDAIEAAKSAAANAKLAADANDDAVRAANEAGANAAEAVAAAQRARANADRATRAAQAAERYLNVAKQAAAAAQAAANRAAANAEAAAQAAIEAAEHAGEAAQAAARATEHAVAATEAAQAAVDAATQAGAVFVAAREADAERLAVAKEEADEAARAAKVQFDAQQQVADWDAEQAAKRDAQTNQLLALARNPATPAAEAAAAGRRVALNLAQAQGAYTQEAALAALRASDYEVLVFARTGLAAANALDDRKTVMDLAAATDNAALAAAAQAALDGTDAQVREFLRTQDYPGRIVNDRIQVNQILATAKSNGDAVMAQRAQAALDAGTLQALRDFLGAGQYDAAAVGERVRVNQLLAAADSGPELKAAAQVALDGPPNMLREFLATGQYTAGERDYEAAAHLSVVGGLLKMINQVAETATQSALEAHEVAARARGDAEQAANYAQQAAQSAAQAAAYAQQAQEYANQAAASVQKAAAAVNTARAAATRANASARSAIQSATWAIVSHGNAIQAARQAHTAAKQAYDSAVAAHHDAELAAEAAKAAFDAYYYDKQVMIADCMASLGPGTIGEAYEKLYNGTAGQAVVDCVANVVAEPHELAKRAFQNGATCEYLYPQGSQGYRNCLNTVLDPLFAANQKMALLVQAVGAMTTLFLPLAAGALVGCMLTVCGLAAGTLMTVGEVGLNVFKLINGDQSLSQTILNLGQTALEALLLNALGRVLSVGFRSLRALYVVTQTARAAETGLRDTSQLTLLRLGGLAECLRGHSFDPRTPVRMADGSARRISAIKVGDPVLATDPATGRTTGEAVTRVWRHRDRALTDLTVADGAGATATIRTTPTHPFWSASARAWVDAADVAPGSRLGGRGIARATVTDSRTFAGSEVMYDLTVANTHTFYVLAGSTPLLVHNTGCEQVILEAFEIRASGAFKTIGVRRNIAVARTEIEGRIPDLFSSVSGSPLEGFVPMVGSENNPQLFIPWKFAGDNPRLTDPEYKILNYLAYRLGDNPNLRGKIYLYSERPVCPSCDFVMSQFRTRYPHIELIVLWG
jgi:Pretoxin HINT domain/Short repeats of unknown function/The  BURPS668_1122 family of deaminases